MKKKVLINFFAWGLMLFYYTQVQAQCYSCTGPAGQDQGDVNVIANATWSGDVYFDNLTINAGVVITAGGSTPLIIHANGTFDLEGAINGAGGNAYENAAGTGTAGGGNGGAGGFGDNGGTTGGGAAGGAGGSGGGNNDGEGSDSSGSNAGANNGNYLTNPPTTSSGGGGGGGYDYFVPGFPNKEALGGGGGGGAGGGTVVVIACGTITIGNTGVINVKGGAGYIADTVHSDGLNSWGNAGGGGGGGNVYLSSLTNSVVINGSVQVDGGAGDGANAGAQGYIGIYGTLSGNFTFTPNSNSVYTYQTLDASVTSITETPTLCNGNANGKVFVTTWQNSYGNGYTYLWSSGSSVDSATALSAGPYTVTITDPSGCTLVVADTVTQPDSLEANITTTPAISLYSNGTATANPTGGTSPYTYAWSTGALGQMVTGFAANTYSMTVTDAHGCTEKDEFVVGLSTGIAGVSSNEKITVFPNPATDKLFVTLNNPTTLSISNILGETILQKEMETSGSLNISTLSPGVYFIYNQQHTQVAKFIKE